MSGPSLCTASAIELPVISNLNFQPPQVEFVSGYSTSIPGLNYWNGHDELNVENLSFCNVSLTYTHDGHTKPINTQVYLPLKESWNGRMVGVGGGGWGAGVKAHGKQEMVGSVSEGYAAVGTNGGGDPYNTRPKDWMLNPDGSVNKYLLKIWSSDALDDAAQIGKAVTETFYGTPPSFSYWHGCSQGGRQGMELAQRYPDAYDGILSVAPAINIASFLSANYLLPFLMDQAGEYPHKCEFDALREAAIAECDHEDGVSDGIIANPKACLDLFDPLDLIGTPIPCSTDSSSLNTINISSTAAKVAKTAWHGPKFHNGLPMASGYSPDADLTNQFGQARTLCDATTRKCHATDPHILTSDFLTQMVRKDVDLSQITQIGFEQLYHTARGEFDNIFATNNANLSSFRDAGGKMIAWHGSSDEIIPPGGSRAYFETVLSHDPQAREYFRYFDAPGVGHCIGGRGPVPTRAFADLVAWVEHGKAPETLLARGPPDEKGEVIHRPLCVYPLVARYKGSGSEKEPENYYCADGYLSATPIRLIVQRARKLWEGRGMKKVKSEV